MALSGDPLFTFAVISDSHVNETEGTSASPYESNKLANARLRYVVAALNHHRPAFIVHLGDMVNPLPELKSCEAAVRNFKAIVAGLEAPLHVTAGNHGVGDKSAGWVPVPRVAERYLAQWEEWYGNQFYSFDHGTCHFVVLSSLLVNSGTEREHAQSTWLEADLARAHGVGRRIFVMMHYPFYVAGREEPGSYDNVDEPGRAWLLDLCGRYGVEAAFSGHVHNYFYNRHGSTDLYTVPATSFVRQDYGEIYSVAPRDAEGGRNDTAKLGYFLVEVHREGHQVRHCRTQGTELAPGEGTSRPATLPSPGPARRRPLPLGVEIRENWLARRTLPTNNSVSAFTRRWARNDWPLVTLSEMGIARLRIFLHELEKDDVVSRMADLRAQGYEHTVYSYGLPNPREYELIRDNAALLSGWELIARPDQVRAFAETLERLAAELTDRAAPLCYLNEVREMSRVLTNDANVRHVANYGFQVAEREHVTGILASEAIAEVFRGLVFRLRRREESRIDVWPAVLEVSRLGRETGMRHQVHVLFSGNVTAERCVDDLATANRVAEAAFAAAVAGHVDVWYDSFEDSDRGYFVRHGLVDRLYDPRLAARVLSRLGAALAEHDLAAAGESLVSEITDGRSIAVELGDRFVALVLPAHRSSLAEIVPPVRSTARSLTVLDLDSGEESEVRVEPSGDLLLLETPLSVASPRWIVGEL